MSEVQKGNDQSMDDILASIRKIISDDDVPASDAPSASPEVGQGLNVPMSTTAAVGQPSSDSSGAPAPDDLSDILEPAPDAGITRTDPTLTAIPEPAAQPVDAPWPFDADNRTAPVGSLQSKLASLDTVPTTAQRELGPSVHAAGGMPEAKLSPVVETEEPVAPTPQPILTNPPVENGAATLVQPAPSVVVRAVPNESVNGPVAVTPEPSPVVESVKHDVPADEAATEPQVSIVNPIMVADVAAQAPVDDPIARPEEPVSASGADSVPVAENAAIVAAQSDEAVISAVPGSNASDAIMNNTLEAVVAETLRPMLREWLDANMPRLVEEEVKNEVARLARNMGRKPEA